MLESAQNVILPVMQIALISFPIFVVCRWRQQMSFSEAGVISTGKKSIGNPKLLSLLPRGLLIAHHHHLYPLLMQGQVRWYLP